MKILRANRLRIFAWLGIGLLMAWLSTAVLPQRAAAAGESYAWSGSSIVAQSGVFSPSAGATTTFAAVSAPAGSTQHLYNSPLLSSTIGGVSGGTACSTAQYRITVTTPNPGTSPNYTAQIDHSGSCGPNLQGQIILADTPPSDVVPPVTTGTGGTTGSTTGGTEEDQCEKDSKDLGWLVCAAIRWIADAVQNFDEFILDQLTIDTDSIFNTSKPSGQAFRTAWGAFRNISFALLIILGLIMILSQIAGLEVFDAYTIRKMLPKLIIAVIFIALSWNIMQFLFNLSNDSANAIIDLIKAPFQGINVASVSDGGDFTLAALITVLLTGVGVGGLAYLAILGAGGNFALLGTALLFVFSAFLLLSARTVVAYLLIISSPVIILCSAFEPFKKLFTLGRTFAITILLSVPAIAAVIELSHIGALIAYLANNKFSLVTAIAIFLAGYALVWGTFKKLDQVAGQLGGVIGNVTGKASQGLAKYRSNTFKRRFGEGVGYERNFRGPLGLGGLADRAANTARRFKVAGQVGGSWRGTAYQAGATRIAEAASAKAADEDSKALSGSGGDDDTMRVLSQTGLSEDRAITALMASANTTRADAETRIRKAQTDLGAEVGTRKMELAALRSLHHSNTGYAPGNTQDSADQAMIAMYEDVARQVISNNLTVTGGAAMIGENKNRVERAAGFGSRMTYVQRAVDRVRQGLPALTTQDVEALRDEAILGSDPGTIINSRHESYTQLAPAMLRRYQRARNDYNQAQAAYEAHPAVQQLAAARNAVAQAQTQLAGNPNDAALQQAAQATAATYQQAQAAHDADADAQRLRVEAGDARVAAASTAAGLANIYQYASYASEQKGRILAQGVMGRAAYDGTTTTVQQDLDTFRGDAAFTAQRQEFAQRYGTPEEMAERQRIQGAGAIGAP